MPVQIDFALSKFEDGTLVVNLAPAAPIGARNIRCLIQRRFGGISGLITKTGNSGYNNVSGINITDSGKGQFNVSIASADTSGLDPGNYAYTIEAMDNPRTQIVAGYMLLSPATGLG